MWWIFSSDSQYPFWQELKTTLSQISNRGLKWKATSLDSDSPQSRFIKNLQESNTRWIRGVLSDSCVGETMHKKPEDPVDVFHPSDISQGVDSVYLVLDIPKHCYLFGNFQESKDWTRPAAFSSCTCKYPSKHTWSCSQERFRGCRWTSLPSGLHRWAPDRGLSVTCTHTHKKRMTLMQSGNCCISNEFHLIPISLILTGVTYFADEVFVLLIL